MSTYRARIPEAQGKIRTVRAWSEARAAARAAKLFFPDQEGLLVVEMRSPGETAWRRYVVKAQILWSHEVVSNHGRRANDRTCREAQP